MNVTSHKSIHLECSFVAPSEFKPTATSQWLLTLSPFSFPEEGFAHLATPSGSQIDEVILGPRRKIKFRMIMQQKGFQPFLTTERIETIFLLQKMNDSKQKFLSIFGGIFFVRQFNNDTATNEWTLQRHIVDAKANIGEHQLKLVLSPIVLQVSRDSNCLAGYFCPTVPCTVTQTGFVESWFTSPGIQWPTWWISKWISSDVRNEEHSNSKSITKETKHGGLKRVTFPPLLLHFLVKMPAYMFSAIFIPFRGCQLDFTCFY